MGKTRPDKFLPFQVPCPEVSCPEAVPSAEMSGYSEDSLERKLSDLNNSAQSIQQLSLWLIHHRRHFQSFVKVWFKELGKSPNGKRKLTLLYLANDVVQNSKKKHPEIAKEFGSVMVKVISHLNHLKDLDAGTVKSVARLLAIWQDRGIFDNKVQSEMAKIWTSRSLAQASSGGGGNNNAKATDSTPPPPAKKPKIEASRRTSSVHSTGSSSSEKQKQTSPQKTTSQQIKEILHSPSGLLGSENGEDSAADKSAAPAGDPPEPEELIKAIQDLENAASSDAAVREKISRLPPEGSESSHLEKIASAAEGRELLAKVNQATTLLTEYNLQLTQELKDRKRVDKMIADFLAAQKDLLAQAEERLELYRDKLDKVNAVKDDLQSHIQSLPDLTKLPDVTGGLAPLPSAGDLFTK